MLLRQYIFVFIESEHFSFWEWLVYIVCPYKKLRVFVRFLLILKSIKNILKILIFNYMIICYKYSHILICKVFFNVLKFNFYMVGYLWCRAMSDSYVLSYTRPMMMNSYSLGNFNEPDSTSKTHLL